MASATLLLIAIVMLAALTLTSLGSSATTPPSSLPQPQTAAATIESMILSAMAPFLQAREVWKQQRANPILYPVIESLMKYGLPVIGIVILVLVLYRLYPNAFRYFTIFGLLNYFGGGSATNNIPVYGGRGFVGIVAGAVSAAGGVVLTLVRFMARRPGAGTTETPAGQAVTAISGRSGGFLLAATFTALAVMVAYWRGPGSILNSIRAVASAPVRAVGAVGAAFRNLRARVERPAEPQDDLELQPVIVPPPPDPQKPGLLQLL